MEESKQRQVQLGGGGRGDHPPPIAPAALPPQEPREVLGCHGPDRALRAAEAEEPSRERTEGSGEMGNRKVLPRWPRDVLLKGKKCLLIGRRGAIAALSLMAREASGRQAAGARFLPWAKAAAQSPGTGVSPRGHPRRASGGRRRRGLPAPGFPESGAGEGGGPGAGSSWGRTTEGS